MRYLVLLGAMAVLLVFVSTAMATTTGEWDIAGLQPFTAEANYMSLAGYFRWQHFLDHGQWLTMMEARRMLKAEGINPDAR